MNETKRDGKWIDQYGCCKLCDGEIPHGHTHNCDLFVLEQQNRQALDELERRKKEKAEVWQELDGSFALAEERHAAEKLSGNEAQLQYWKGELAVLHRIRQILKRSDHN